ncbi:MAG: universal stress protein [Aestuariibaculum sp.]
MKTIIVASDFSKEAENATQYAIDTAKYTRAKLVLFNLHELSIHTINSRLSYSAVQELIESYRINAERRVANISEENNIAVKLDFAMGNFYDQLKRSVKEYSADLVVLGMHEKNLEDDLLGSTTTAALHKLEVPVLAVPINAKFTKVERILFACDLERGVTSSVLRRVKVVAKRLKAQLEVFHVEDTIDKINSNSEKNIKTISEELEGVSYMFKSVQSDAIIAEIQKEIKHFKPNVLVMVPYEYGFWSSLVHKSKTRVMASGMNIPLLSVKGRKL